MQATNTIRWISVKDAATSSGYNAEYIRQLVRSGSLSARRVATRMLIDARTLAKYQAQKSTTKAGRPSVKKPGVAHTKDTAGTAVEADPYLSDMSVRMQRNAAVIAYLDALSNADAAGVAEQKETMAYLERVIDADRPSYRARFKPAAAGTK